MLPANNLFLDDSIEKRISIVSDDETINLTNADIHSEKFTLKESICSETSLKVGNCEANSVEFTIDNTPPSMTGKWLTITITPYNRNGTAGTAISLGRFKVFSDKPSGDRQTRTILAYDKLFYVSKRNYKRWYRKVAFSESDTLTIKQFRDAFFEKIGITQVSATLSNDGMSIKRVKVASKLTGKDILTAICEINGVFGHITRDGEFKYIKLSTNTSATSIGKTYTINVEYSDNALTAVDRVEMLGKNGDLLASVGNDEDSYTNKYTIENNFIVNGLGGKAYYETALQAMRTVLTTLSFVPLTAEMKGHPRYEVGDRITYSVGDTTKTSFILNRTMTGIQALYDTYDSNVEEYYSNEPNAVNSKTAQIQSMEYQIGAVEDMTNTHLEKMDDGTIVIRDESLAGDEDSGATCTRSWCMFTYSGASDTWTIWRVEIKCTNYSFLIADGIDYGGGGSGSGNYRSHDVNGKVYNEMSTWLIFKIPRGAEKPIIYEKNTYISSNKPQYKLGTRWDNDNNADWGEWGQAYTVNPASSYKVITDDYEYLATTHTFGTPFHGMYGMSYPDKHYPSEDALLTAFRALEINPPALKNGDIVLPSATAQQAELDGLLGLANTVTGSSGEGDERNPETGNIDNIPVSGTPTNVETNNKQLSINNAINTIKNGLESWIASIIDNGRGNIIATIKHRGSGVADTYIHGSTNLITSGSEPPLTGAAQNDLHCVLADESGIVMSQQSSDGDYDFSVSRYGYKDTITSKHDASGDPLSFQQFIIKITGLTSGTSYTVSYKLSAATYDASANEYSNVTYTQATIEGVTKRYGRYGVMFTDTTSPDMTGVPTFGSDNTWDSALKWQNFPDLQRPATSFSNTFTATASTMYMVFRLEPITTHDYPLYEKFWVEELKESNMSISFNALKVYGEDDTWYEFAGGGQGTMDYDNLENQPQINSVTLSGNKTSRDLQIFEKKHLAEFEQLSTAQKNNPDKFYFVDDKGGSGGGGGGGGSSTLAGLTDVDLSSPTNGQVLEYDATNQVWKNADASGGGGTTVVANPSGAATDTLNKLQVGETIYGVGGDNENGIFAKSIIQSQNILSEFEYKNTPLKSHTQNIVMFPYSDHVVNTTSVPATELSDNNVSCTVYAVVRSKTTGGNYNLISSMYANSSGNAPNFFTNSGTIRTSVYGSDTNTGVSSMVYHVLVLAIDNTTKKARYYIDGVAYSGEKSFNNSGKYIGFCSSINASTDALVNPCFADLIYGAVVLGAETEEKIVANSALIMTEYADYIGH